MAVHEDVVLVSDGGDVTVGRRTATFVYGEFNVVLPRDREQVETDDRLQDGYVYRPDTGVSGPFDVGFVRADATIDLEADSSDLEVVVDAAQKQSEGDVFFERDITGSGLGRFALDRDFQVGDVVSVEVWGKRVLLPVTAGDYVASESEGVLATRVHVGGQLISDAEAVAHQNHDLRRQIAREKAERQRSVAAESSARANAIRAESAARREEISTERQARVSAIESEQSQRRADLAKIREFLGGVNATDTSMLSQLAAVNAQIVSMSDGSAAPEPGLLNSYLSLNTLLWEQQQKINDLNDDFRDEVRERQRKQQALDKKQNDMIQELEDVRLTNERRRPRSIFATFADYKNGYEDPEGFVLIEPYSDGDRGFQIRCLGMWTGRLVVRATAVQTLGSNSVDSNGVWVTDKKRIFTGVPEAIHMSYYVVDVTIFPN